MEGKNWIYALMTGGYSIWKKWGAKGIGALIMVIVIISPLSANNEEIGLSYKDFKLGMNKSDIPSQVKLVKKSLMSSYDKSYKYTDGNKNKIKINGIDFEVELVVRGDNDKVKMIFFIAKNVKNMSEDELVELARIFTNKQLKKWTMNNYKNGKLSTIGLMHSEINNGIENVFRLVYNNDNGITSKNEITVIQSLIDKKKSDAEIQKMMAKILFRTVKAHSYVCFSLSAYKQLIDMVDAKNDTTPSKCVFTKEPIVFYSTNTEEYYKGRIIVKLKGKQGQELWVYKNFIE